VAWIGNSSPWRLAGVEVQQNGFLAMSSSSMTVWFGLEGCQVERRRCSAEARVSRSLMAKSWAGAALFIRLLIPTCVQ
jgi:hypothetical protein